MLDFDLDLDTLSLDTDGEATGEALETLAAILGRPAGTLVVAEVLA